MDTFTIVKSIIVTAIWITFMVVGLVKCANSPSEIHAVISAVVDGDTIDVVFSKPPKGCGETERVRLIGVNTPELTKSPPEYYAEEARNFTNRWWRDSVRVEFDKVSALRDYYGRLLAYIYVDNGRLLNKLLISEGCGRYYGYFNFETERMKEFAEAEEEARKEEKGIWAAQSKAKDKIKKSFCATLGELRAALEGLPDCLPIDPYGGANVSVRKLKKGDNEYLYMEEKSRAKKEGRSPDFRRVKIEEGYWK